MSMVWDAQSYDSERRRLVPCFNEFYSTVADLVRRFCPPAPRILDLGAGTGIVSSAILERVGTAELTLLDASGDMLKQAQKRLTGHRANVLEQGLTEKLPDGPYDAVVSALAIHHLPDLNKRDLYRRILRVLAPGGIFLNAEQVGSASPRLQQLFEATHLERARELGSSEAEIKRAIQRMAIDQCASVSDQMAWLEQAGFQDVECFFRWFRFAVFGGWKSK